MPNKNFNPNGIDYILFTPGPSQVPDWILKEMAKGNDTHRSTAYRQMHKSLRESFRKLLHTQNEILFFASSGTGIMEACVRNLIAEDETALFFSCGAFGDRWKKIADECGKKAELVAVPKGKGITPELVKDSLSKKKYPIVCITGNETSTGVANPIDKIAPIIKATGALLCVDFVSSMGGIDIKVDEWGLDVALSSTQKCFAVPPGLSICAISNAAFAKAETVKGRGHYLDFLALKKSSANDEHPVTPPIPQMRALKASVDKILENPELHYKRHEELTNMIRDWAIKHGFKIFSEEGYHSNTVVTIQNNLNMDVEKFVSGLFEKGYKIVNGYSDMKGKNFRIAPMGYITKEQTEAMLNAATDVLKTMKVI